MRGVYHLKLRFLFSLDREMECRNIIGQDDAMQFQETWNAFVCKITFKPPSGPSSEQETGKGGR